MKKHSKAPPASQRQGRARAAASVATVAIVAGYVFVSGTFVLPTSPAQAAVEDVFAPYFSQKWELFAPNISRTNTSMEIQGQWRDANGELVHSEWIAATEIEFASFHGVPSPSRIGRTTVNAASAYVDRYEELSDEQQERVEDTFIQRDGDGGFEPIPDEELVDEIDELGDNRGDVVRFIRYDYMLTRFADAFAEAHFDTEIERVRWRVEFDRPNDFDERFEPQIRPASTVEFGWRQPARDTAEDVAAVFDDVLSRYER